MFNKIKDALNLPKSLLVEVFDVEGWNDNNTMLIQYSNSTDALLSCHPDHL